MADDPRNGGGDDALMPRTTLRPAAAPTSRHDLVPMLSSPAPVPVGPLEAKVLACVDGRRSVTEIGAVVGLASVETLHLLERLVALVPGLTLAERGSVVSELLDGGWDDPEGQPTAEVQLTPEQLRALEAQYEASSSD